MQFVPYVFFFRPDPTGQPKEYVLDVKVDVPTNAGFVSTTEETERAPANAELTREFLLKFRTGTGDTSHNGSFERAFSILRIWDGDPQNSIENEEEVWITVRNMDLFDIDPNTSDHTTKVRHDHADPKPDPTILEIGEGTDTPVDIPDWEK